MTVEELTENYARLESQIATEKGDFTLFALFLREDVPDRWDLVVSAMWVGEDHRSAVDYLIAQIKEKLGEQDLTSLARIVIIDPGEEGVHSIDHAEDVHVQRPLPVVHVVFPEVARRTGTNGRVVADHMDGAEVVDRHIAQFAE